MKVKLSETESLAIEIEELRARLAEAEETLDAIRSGAVDALVVSGPRGDQVYTLSGADHTYRRFVEEMSEGAAVLTVAGDILYCNQCLADILGLPLEGLVGSSLYRVFSESGQGDLRTVLAKALEGGSSGEYNLNTGHSDSIPVLLSATPLTLDGVTAICLVVTDLTEQKRQQQIMAAHMKRLEEEQSKANKLESLGILAGGLAHDLNNSLTSILGNISLVRRSVDSDDNTLSRLSQAEAACLQARDVAQQLLTFSRGGAPVKELASIAQLLRDWAGFALSGSSVRCEFEIAANLRPVEIDTSQLARAINNLLINAQQAMPEGGTITIRATNLTLGTDNTDTDLPLPAGTYVRIEVQDTGIGIPTGHLPKVFDPYFTTKQTGSGLGLAVVYSIVKAHGGYITVQAQLGAGTIFRIYLPASSSVPTGKEHHPESAYEGKLRVLVLDDQEAIRELIRSILADIEEHEVDFAHDGIQAIELYKKARQEGRPFDVVLMDLTIPGGMGGKEAVKKLLEIDPNAKTIVFSGYSNDPVMSKYQEYGFKGVLQKPFGIDEFLDALHAVTASSQDG